MLEFLYEYGLFLAKTATLVVAVGVVIGMVASARRQSRREERRGRIQVVRLNDRYATMSDRIRAAVFGHKALKQERKARKKQDKARKKQAPAQQDSRPRRVYLLDFKGDIKASATEELRHAITAVLDVAESEDEVVISLESAGGLVHSYGLAASQLDRIRKAGIPLTVSVDKVAASGGYMMACVADRIIAAPFAVIGSIGVVAQLPNFHRLLKKHDVDYELLTAGEYKRTLTVFGENTDEGRAKFQQDLEETHALFKDFVQSHRAQVDVDRVATGEIWYGRKALETGLVDDLQTSDEYLTAAFRDGADLYFVAYRQRKPVPERVGLQMENVLERLLGRLWQNLRLRYFS